MDLSMDQIIVGVGTLGAVITHLYWRQIQYQAKTEVKLEKCESGHKDGQEEVKKLLYKVGKLEGMQALHDEVIKTVRGGK